MFMRFADEGRRIVAAGFSPDIQLWYLGEDFGVERLGQRLADATERCLSVEQRMQFIGESRDAATSGRAACLHR